MYETAELLTLPVTLRNSIYDDLYVSVKQLLQIKLKPNKSSNK